MDRWTRRRFLAVAGAGVGAGVLAACGQSETPSPADAAITRDMPADAPPASAAVVATPTPTPTPIPEPPLLSLGTHALTLMEGTEFEARGQIFHSGRSGPRVMVLGGVHGNEPGGWMAAEGIADWEVSRGMLIVLPRINHRSAAIFERTLPEYGDLNRLYPGDPEGLLPMARMASEITAIAQEWRPHWLFDLHESWGFFNERGENGGTAFIGQTVSAGSQEGVDTLEAILARVNERISAREEISLRFRPNGNFGGRGTSSLSLGRFVPGGMNTVLVEMGQDRQAEWRRAELHQILMREMLDHLRMS